jgi:hypothetical protein
MYPGGRRGASLSQHLLVAAHDTVALAFVKHDVRDEPCALVATPCSPLKVIRHFGGTCRFCFQG